MEQARLNHIANLTVKAELSELRPINQRKVSDLVFTLQGTLQCKCFEA